MPETLIQLRNRLQTNLDDPHGTGWSNAKLDLLLNEALQWVVNQATINKHFPRTNEHNISATIGTNEYVVNEPNVRHIVKIEELDGDSRWDGTLIPVTQRNDQNTHWLPPIMYISGFKEATDGKRWHLRFQRPNQPQDSKTIIVTWAPEINKLTDDQSFVTDIGQDFMDLLVLRATIMGYGGEKNADQFWFSQFTGAQQTAIELLENTINDDAQYVRQVDNDYY